MTGPFAENILCFDTALGGVSVGVFTQDGRHAVRQVETLRDQAAILVPLINAALEEVSLSYQDVGRIVTTIGPGSFTGLRIGLSTARSLGLALGMPVVGISTLQACAAMHRGQDVLCVLETKRKDFYLQAFDADGNAQTEPLALTAEEIETQVTGGPYLLVGDAGIRFEEAMPESWKVKHLQGRTDLTLIDPASLAELGAQADPETARPDPLYLRGADVSQPKHPPRKIKQAASK